MRTFRLPLAVSLLAASAANAICAQSRCTCEPSIVIADAQLNSDGGLVFANPRWSDGGTAPFNAETWLRQLDDGYVPPGASLLVGGRPAVSTSSTNGGLEFAAFVTDDGGTTVTCDSMTVPINEWKAALRVGSCASLVPATRCNDVVSRCSSSGVETIFPFLTMALLRRRRVKQARPSSTT